MAKTNLGTAWVTVKPSMQGFQSDVKSKLSGLGNAISSSIGNEIRKSTTVGVALGNALYDGAKNIASKIASTVGDTLKASLGQLDTLTRSRNALTQMGYSLGDVNKRIEQLRKNSNQTAATLDSEVDGLLALSASWGDLGIAADATQALSDAILSFGGTADMVANAVTQISQVGFDGPLDAQTWLSLRNSGLVPVLGTLAEMNKMSLTDYKEALGKGKITTRQFVEQLIALDKNGTKSMASLETIAKSNAAATIGGSFETAKNAIVSALEGVFESFKANDIAPLILKAGDNIAKWISGDMVKSIKNIIKWIKDVWSTAKVYISKLRADLKPLADFIKSTLSKVLSTLGAALKNIWDLIKKLTSNQDFVNTIVTLAEVFMAVQVAVGLYHLALKAGVAIHGVYTAAVAKTTAAVNAAAAVSGIAVGALGLLAGALLVAKGAAIQHTTATIKETTAERLRTDAVRMAEDAQRAYNRSLQLTEDLLNSLNDANAAVEDTEIDVINKRAAVTEAQKRYNAVLKNNKATADEVRLAELELSKAKRELTEAEVAHTKAVEDAASATASYNSNQMTAIVADLKAQAARLSSTNSYADLAAMLDEASKATWKYKDATGKMAEATKEDIASSLDFVSSEVSKNDAFWKTVNETARAEGISYADALKKVGEQAGLKFDEGQAEGVKKNYHVITDAVALQAQETKKSAYDTFRDLGANIVEGLNKGIENSKSKLTKTANNLASIVANVTAKVNKIKSPSRRMMELGRYISEGYAIGISEKARDAERAAMNLSSSVSRAMSSAMTDPFSVGAGSVDVPSRVIQNNVFNVNNGLDVKEISSDLGYAVAMA